jgi:hypothetical protein
MLSTEFRHNGGNARPTRKKEVAMPAHLATQMQEYMFFSLCAQTAIVLMLVVIWLRLRKQDKQK